MTHYRFQGIDNNTTLQGIGPLVRQRTGNQWNVNVHCYPYQSKSYFSMSEAPVLALKRILNPTIETQKAGDRRIVVLSKNRQWFVKRIGSCPIEGFNRRSDAEQYCFAFIFNDSSDIVYLPQFELARALFFHNEYLARTAIESDCLNTEFEVDHIPGDEHANIKVMPTSGYPLPLLCAPASRKHLSWILLDAAARESFRSISLNQFLYAYDQGWFRVWDFRFDPPPLDKVRLDVRGYYDPHTRSFFVFEIDRILGLVPDMPERVDFIHPDYERPIPEAQYGAVPRQARDRGQITIHDRATANADTQPIVIDAPPVEIEFNKPIITTLVPVRDQRSGMYKHTEYDEQDTLSVSTEEAISGRGRPQASWNISTDSSDDTQLFESKFKCFLQMVDQLVKRYRCVLRSKEITKLPKLKRCKKHLLSTDSTPRCIAVIKLELRGRLFILLEVDTSDADKALSTQLLAIKYQSIWESYLDEVKQELVRTSLSWPKEILAEICGKHGFKGITHPHSPAGNRRVLDAESIEGWATRVFYRMKAL